MITDDESLPRKISVVVQMAPSLLSPAAVSHHHYLTPSIHFFSPCSCSTSKVIPSHRWSLLPSRSSKLRRGRCSAAIPPPESEPPPGDDQSSSSGSIVSLSRFQESVQIFCAVFFWMSLFFWSSVWDGRNKGGSDKGPRFWK